MVSFRYHLTSLAAVLLALAVGILVGGAALGSAASTTASDTSAASDQALRRTQSTADDFARQVGPALVKGSLSGQKVLVVLTPDARAGIRDAALKALQAAGATLAGQVRLGADLLAPSASQTVDDVVAAVVPAGLELPDTTAIDRAGAELASVLLTSTKGTNGNQAARDKVLGGFAGADLLVVEGAEPVPATSVLLLTGATRGHSAAVAALADALQKRVGVVVAGPVSAASPQGVLDVIRSGNGGGLSTVDGVETPQGLVAVALALAEQVNGSAGHYGTGQGARSMVPARR